MVVRPLDRPTVPLIHAVSVSPPTQNLDPSLGLELPERPYGADCRLWVPGQGVNWEVRRVVGLRVGASCCMVCCSLAWLAAGRTPLARCFAGPCPG